MYKLHAPVTADMWEEDLTALDDVHPSDELSAEDQAALAEGTAKVQGLLGTEASKVTIPQIHDALWYYYFDADKSAAYLTRTHITPPPVQPAKAAPDGTYPPILLPPDVHSANPQIHLLSSRIQQQTQSVRQKAMANPRSGRVGVDPVTAGYPFEMSPQVPPAWYFHDMPWLNTPSDRHSSFTAPQALPGGLLGGSDRTAKMSKLQAMAAARSKKRGDKMPDDAIHETRTHLSQLSISGATVENTKPGQSLSSKRKKDEQPGPLTVNRSPPHEPRHKRRILQEDLQEEDTSSHMDVEQSTADATPDADSSVVCPPSVMPSAFARTLFGSAAGSAASTVHRFSFPYMESPEFRAEAFETPSPDDVVFAAQAQAGRKSKPPPRKADADKKGAKGKKAGPDGELDASVEGMEKLEITGAVTPPKGKGLDVVKEFEDSKQKRSASFVVVGHVDAGKSTLMGRLLLELKFVDEQTVEKYRRQAEKIGKQSFALAWVMDQRTEERERGVTMDIATNQFETEKTRFTILDAPGHQDFVPNMIAGATQADFAILVVDGNTGAFEKGLKGQTKEHALLLRSLGIQRVIVAVNKLDMVSWSQERFDEISAQVTGFLSKTGFQSKNITFIPISGLNGDNLVTTSKNEAISWYKGSTLIEELEASEPMTRALRKPFRMSISEVFRSDMGAMKISGRIDSGTIQTGDVLVVQPSGEKGFVRSLELDSATQDWAVAGQNVSIQLTGIDLIHVKVGDMISHTTSPIEVSDIFTIRVLAFDHLLPMPVDVHRGRLHAAGHLQSMPALLDKATGEVIKKKPKVVAPGSVARVVVKLASKVPLEAGQRVVLRSGGETIAAGLLE